MHENLVNSVLEIVRAIFSFNVSHMLSNLNQQIKGESTYLLIIEICHNLSPTYHCTDMHNE